MPTLSEVLRDGLGDLEQTANLLEWCRRQQRCQGQPPLVRFVVAQYQIFQAQEGQRSAWAAFVVNLLCAAEGAGAKCDAMLPAHLVDHPRLRWDDAVALGSLTRLAQQFLYLHTCRPGMVRYDRVDKGRVAWLVGGLVSLAWGQLDVGERRQFLAEEVDRLEAFEYRAPTDQTKAG